MIGKNISFVLNSALNVEYTEREIPSPEDDEVLVQISCTGICGSDVHYWKHGRIGDFVVEQPMCLGHESSGTVYELGRSVKRKQPALKVGDRVALEPGSGCGRCTFCVGGSYNLCEQMTFAATPPSTFGTLARYYKVPFDKVHPLPDSLSMVDGALIEPLAVAVHAVHKLAQTTSDQVVIVFGAGPVGLLCMAVAKALGASRIVAVDISPERLAFAKSYAATDIYIPPDTSEYDHASQVCQDILYSLRIPRSGHGAIQVAIEASGAAPCQQLAFCALEPRGRYVQVGLGGTFTQAVPLLHIVNKELVVLGSFRYGPGDYSFAIRLVERGLVDLKQLVTHTYRFEQALQAFETTARGKDVTGKACIKCIIEGPL